MKLGLRISFCIFGLVVLALASSGLALYAAWESNRLIGEITTVHLPNVKAAEEVEIALLEQRVTIAGFLLTDGNRERLADLDRARSAFEYWWKRADAVSHTAEERETLKRLMDVYRKYDRTRTAAIDVYDIGQPDEAKRLFDELTRLYQEAFQLCEHLIEVGEASAQAMTVRSDRRMDMVMWFVGAATAMTVALAAVLLWLFFRGILQPLRTLLHEVRPQLAMESEDRRDEEEMHLVGAYLRRILLDMQDAKTALDKSRTQLQLAERLASVGKLTASVAHEIRNPLTAMKMWLFSARDALIRGSHEDRLLQKLEDEIHRLETIVRHFLEFARPPEPRFQPTALAGIIEDSLELTRPLLMEKDIQVIQNDFTPKCVLQADREQLIQVFSNLFHNAAQAAAPNGRLTISASVESSGNALEQAVIVRIADTGGGVSSENQERLFEPFFSTRPDGTGLGLCIAAAIVARHQGRVYLESTSFGGSVFAVQLPLKEESV